MKAPKKAKRTLQPKKYKIPNIKNVATPGSAKYKKGQLYQKIKGMSKPFGKFYV